MKRYLFYGFLFVLITSLFLVAIQIIKIQEAIKKTPYNSTPFVREYPKAKLRFLFIGDSTAVGTGAINNVQSVAGRFGKDFPQAQIENEGVNGRRLKGLVENFNPKEQRDYDLVVVQIGGNDILRFTPQDEIENNISIIIKRAKFAGKFVVILHSGNVGLAPIFIWPFDWILTERARQMRSLYMKKAKEENVMYVDLFTERSNDLFLKNIDKYYSSDLLHPSGDGYAWWYERIRGTLKQANVSFQL